MGRYLMKCAPDLDLYLEWSTVVDNAVWVGTRSEALRLPQTDEDRLARTDRTGTSMLWPVEGSWEDKSIHVCNTVRHDPDVYSYTLNRADLTAYAEAMHRGDTQQAEALLRCNPSCRVCDIDTGHRPGDEWPGR